MDTNIRNTPHETPPISEQAQKEKRIAVVETFGPTIQGEGPLAGSKTMFIRFGGCDYRCKKCDSLHAVMPAAVKANADYLTAEEIADRIIPAAKRTGTPWVTLSGGNPCMWDLTRLISILHGAELGVAVETQGTLSPEWLQLCQMVVVSPKSPGMGEKFEKDKFVTFLKNFTRRHKEGRAQPAVALKVVLFSEQDAEFMLEVIDIASQEAYNIIHPGLLFASIGNDHPPRLNSETNLLEDSMSNSDIHRLELLRSYRRMAEYIAVDPRVTHVKILPQLHVLAWGNESER